MQAQDTKRRQGQAIKAGDGVFFAKGGGWAKMELQRGVWGSP